MEKYILVNSIIAFAGYKIEHTEHDSLDAAQTAMRKAYDQYTPDDWYEKEGKCYCGEMNAAMYDKEENVYLWQIIPVVFKEAVNE